MVVMERLQHDVILLTSVSLILIWPALLHRMAAVGIMYPYFVNKVKYESELDPTIVDVSELTN